jgi:hypothetical protein
MNTIADKTVNEITHHAPLKQMIYLFLVLFFLAEGPRQSWDDSLVYKKTEYKGGADSGATSV